MITFFRFFEFKFLLQEEDSNAISFAYRRLRDRGAKRFCQYSENEAMSHYMLMSMPIRPAKSPKTQTVPMTIISNTSTENRIK